MSSITQARLAPITQRYMSMSFRRQDWKDKSVAPNVNLESKCLEVNRSFKDVRHPTVYQSSRYEPVRSLKIHTVDRKHIFPKSSTNFNGSHVRSLNSESLVRGSCKQDGSNIIADHHHMRAENFISNHQTYTYPSHHQEQSSTVDEYLFRMKRRIGDLFRVTGERTISRTTAASESYSVRQSWSYKRRGYRDSESYNRGSFNQKPFYITLAVLGLFRKPTEQEIEEGRAQLTDEQKIKKMKPVELKIAKGVLSMCDQEFGKANQLFHEALHIAQDEEDEERENLIFNLIAANYFESGDLENAEKLFIDIMKRMIAHDVAPTAPPILELSLKLASIYSKNPATQEKALKGFKFVINSLLYNLEDIVNNIEQLDIHSISDEKKDELALLGWSYDWFAKHLLIMNDYGGAADMLQRAVQISSLVLGPLHDQTLILLNDIGTTLAMNNSPEEGKIFITKAVEGAIANQSKELASFYVNLALVNLKLSKLDEAKRYCEYSMELAKKNLDHYNTQEVIELSRTCLDEVRRLLDAEGQ